MSGRGNAACAVWAAIPAGKRCWAWCELLPTGTDLDGAFRIGCPLQRNPVKWCQGGRLPFRRSSCGQKPGSTPLRQGKTPDGVGVTVHWDGMWHCVVSQAYDHPACPAGHGRSRPKPTRRHMRSRTARRRQVLASAAALKPVYAVRAASAPGERDGGPDRQPFTEPKQPSARQTFSCTNRRAPSPAFPDRPPPGRGCSSPPNRLRRRAGPG